MSKDVGQAPPVDDIGAAMASRYTTPAQQPDTQPSKTRRSWLLPTDVADALSEAAERIHYDSRGIISKSEAQAAIIRAGLNHLGEAEASLQTEQPAHE